MLRSDNVVLNEYYIILYYYIMPVYVELHCAICIQCQCHLAANRRPVYQT